jgi:hypothetical protein
MGSTLGKATGVRCMVFTGLKRYLDGDRVGQIAGRKSIRLESALQRLADQGMLLDEACTDT